MCGKTPPWRIMPDLNNLLSSSSFPIASWMWRGEILFSRPSMAAFPANSKISALKYLEMSQIDQKALKDCGEINWRSSSEAVRPEFAHPCAGPNNQQVVCRAPRNRECQSCTHGDGFLRRLFRARVHLAYCFHTLIEIEFIIQTFAYSMPRQFTRKH